MHMQLLYPGNKMFSKELIPLAINLTTSIKKPQAVTNWKTKPGYRKKRIRYFQISYSTEARTTHIPDYHDLFSES